MNLPRTPREFLATFRAPGPQTLYTSLVGQAMTLITGVLAARALGVDGRGTLALLWLVPLTLVLLGGLGIPQAATYYVAREREHARAVIAKAVRVTALLALILLALYGAVLLVVASSDHEFGAADGLLSLSLVPMFLAQNLGVATLLGQERYTAYNLTRLGPVVFYAVAAAVLFVLGAATLTTILAAAAVAWGTGAVATWSINRAGLAASAGHTDVATGDIVKFGLRGVIGSVSPIDDVRIDQFMVGLLLDAHALGLYVAAIAFCNLPRLVAQSIGAVAFPRIAAARDAAWAMMRRYLRIGLVAVGIAVAGLLILVPFLLPLLFGDDFSDAVGLSRILLLGAFFLGAHRMLAELARGLGHPGYGSISEVANATVFLAAVLLITGPATVEDVAWAVVAGGVVASGLLGLLIGAAGRRGAGQAPSER